MMTLNSDGLARRIERLELENRRLKRGGLIAALGTSLLFLGGAAIKGTTSVVTEKLVIVDKDGNERIRLGTVAEGYPTLSFMDQEGHIGAFLGQEPTGASLIFSDQADKIRLQLGFTAKGRSHLIMLDEKERERLRFSMMPSGDMGLQLLDRSENPRSCFMLDPEDDPYLFFYHRESPRLGMRLHPDGRPSIGLFDKKSSRVDFGIAEDNVAFISVMGDAGKAGTQVESRETGDSRLRVLDKDGKALFQAPAP